MEGHEGFRENECLLLICWQAIYSVLPSPPTRQKKNPEYCRHHPILSILVLPVLARRCTNPRPYDCAMTSLFRSTTTYDPVEGLLNAESYEKRDQLTQRWKENKLQELNFIGIVVSTFFP